jgi:NAD(P)-dependent dehydrogenase (short-subunit alcohol dehydrogenase family)
MNIARFDGKVALVTGGASGIGRAVVQGLARDGARVVVSDIDAAAGSALVDELRREGMQALFVQADVTHAEQVQALIARAIAAFGRLDIAHNNVGGGSPNPSLTELTEAEWDRTFALCLKSTWLCMKYEIPHMLAQRGGAGRWSPSRRRRHIRLPRLVSSISRATRRSPMAATGCASMPCRPG